MSCVWKGFRALVAFLEALKLEPPGERTSTGLVEWRAAERSNELETCRDNSLLPFLTGISLAADMFAVRMIEGELLCKIWCDSKMFCYNMV